MIVGRLYGEGGKLYNIKRRVNAYVSKISSCGRADRTFVPVKLINIEGEIVFLKIERKMNT